MLSNAEALKKVVNMRKDYARIKGHLDSQIMRVLQQKVDETQEWVSILDQSFAHIQCVEQKFRETEEECKACADRVQQWQTIKQFNLARNNVTTALAELQLLRSMPADIDEVEELMAAEDFDEGYDNLLSIHARLVKLEETRGRGEQSCNSLRSALSLSFESRAAALFGHAIAGLIVFAVVSKYMRREVSLSDSHHLVLSFDKIKSAWENFEDVIEDNIEHAIELAGAESSPATLVRVLRVVERQARVDRWWQRSGAFMAAADSAPL